MSPVFGPDLKRAWKSLRYFDLDACMFGGKRKKRTRLASSADLTHMAVLCDNTHPHLPWSIREVESGLSFDTAAEAQYPLGLCRALAQTFARTFELSGGLLPPPGDFRPLRAGPSRAEAPLVPQFRTVMEGPDMPKGDQYKLLASDLGGNSQGNGQTDQEPGNQPVRFGVRWTPQEFLNQAKTIKHPMNPEESLSDLLKDVVFNNLTQSPLELAKSRIQTVITIRQMAAELEDKEETFKQKLDPVVAKILKPKRILLWKSLLLAANYDDMPIVDLVAGGVPLTGSHGSVPALPEKLVPATDSLESLLASSPLRRRSLTSTERPRRRSKMTSPGRLMMRSSAGRLRVPSRKTKSPNTSGPMSGS